MIFCPFFLIVILRISGQQSVVFYRFVTRRIGFGAKTVFQRDGPYSLMATLLPRRRDQLDRILAWVPL